MKIDSLARKCVLMAFLVAITLCLTPAVIFAEGGEPHNAICEATDFNAYLPPPYLGTVTVDWYASCTINGSTYAGCAILSGQVARPGSGEEIDLTDLVYETGVDLATQFQMHSPGDMRGRCVIGDVMGVPELGAFKIMAVHNFSYTSDTQFTMDAVVMQITTR